MASEPKEYRPRRAWVEPDESPGADQVEDPGPKQDRPETRPTSRLDDDNDTVIRPAVPQAEPPAPEPKIAPEPKTPAPETKAAPATPKPPATKPIAESLPEDDRGGSRARTGVLIGVVSVIAVLGLVIGYFVLNRGDDSPPTTVPTVTPSNPSAPSATPEAVTVLAEASMLTPSEAKGLGKKRTFKVELTQKGVGGDAPQVACLSTEPVEGQPQPNQTILRTLTGSGKDAPAVLHHADSYLSEDEAKLAFTQTATAIGGCLMPSAYITSGSTISGLGNEAVGIVLKSSESGTQYRSLVMARTGRAINFADVMQPTKAVPLSDVVKAFSKSINRQCKAAGGKCAVAPKAAAGPPPMGGDKPGFLATADIPPVGKTGSIWGGDTPGEADVVGSGCEGVNFETMSEPKAKTSRTYLIDDPAAPSEFGIDQVILTMKDKKAAKALVNKIRDNIEGCASSTPTANVSGTESVKGTGASKIAIRGGVALVSQKVNATTTANYRVGVIYAGNKVVYTFLPTKDEFDFTELEWERLTIRAGERVTQVK